MKTDRQRAEEVLDNLDIKEPIQQGEFYYRDEVIEAMLEFASQNKDEVSDEDIEKWATIANDNILPDNANDFERGYWLGWKHGAIAIRDNKIPKAMRDGKIKTN